jgi:MFS family permease
MNDSIAFLIPTLLATFYTIFGLSWEQVLLILAYNALLTVIFQIINGFAADKGFAKTLYIIGFFLVVCSTFLILFSKDYLTLFIFVLISGIALGFQHTLGYNLTAKLFIEPKVRSERLAVQGSWGDTGKMSAVFFTAFMFLLFPNKWEYIIAIWCIYLLSGFIYALYLIRPYKFEKIVEDNIRYSKKYLNGILKVESNNGKEQLVGSIVQGNTAKFRIVILFVMNIINGGIFDLTAKVMPMYLKNMSIGIVAQYPELWFGLFMIFSIFGARSSGKGVNKFGFPKWLQIVMTGLAVNTALFLIIIGKSEILTIIMLIIYPLSIFPLYTMILGEFSKVIPAEKIGKAYGIFLGIGWSGGFICTRIAAQFVTQMGPIINFIIVYILIAIISLLNLFSYKKFK